MSDANDKPWRVRWECEYDGCARGVCDETFATEVEAQAFADAENAKPDAYAHSVYKQGTIKRDLDRAVDLLREAFDVPPDVGDESDRSLVSRGSPLHLRVLEFLKPFDRRG